MTVVVLFPGLGTDGKAMRPLHGLCRSLGLLPLDWGRGFNRGPAGDVEAWVAALADDVAAALDREGSPQRASLIGWSLGGLWWGYSCQRPDDCHSGAAA